MRGLSRWMAKNRTLAKILACTSTVICYSSFLILGLPLWIMIIIDLFLILFFGAWVDARINSLVKPALKALDEQCDPYPLLEETAVQMSYGYKGTLEQINRINHAVALRYAGQYQQALDVLNTINIDRHAGMTTATKLVYYNNLTDLLTLMGRFPEAEVWYQKMVQLYKDMPENRVKQQLVTTVKAAAVDAWFRRGEYAKARECLSSVQKQTLRQRVNGALLYAKCCIAEGNPEGARQPLQFVLDWGNRLNDVQEARSLQIRLPSAVDIPKND